MKIEAVVTCVHYADFLPHTLMLNLRQFDRLLVVTSPEDKATPKVCAYFGVECHITDAFQSRWGRFSKGAGINEGLAKLDRDGWVCHLDADIALPPNSRQCLDRADLDPTFLYGIDRVECKSYESWARFIGAPEPNVAGNGFMIHTTHSPFQLATRVAFGHEGGYIPIGFFQLWNPTGSGISRYPEGHSDAGREDSHFAIQWPRNRRGFLPEVTAYHLESEMAPMCINWQERKTKPFSVDSITR